MLAVCSPCASRTLLHRIMQTLMASCDDAAMPEPHVSDFHHFRSLPCGRRVQDRSSWAAHRPRGTGDDTFIQDACGFVVDETARSEATTKSCSRGLTLELFGFFELQIKSARSLPHFPTPSGASGRAPVRDIRDTRLPTKNPLFPPYRSSSPMPPTHRLPAASGALLTLSALGCLPPR